MAKRKSTIHPSGNGSIERPAFLNVDQGMDAAEPGSDSPPDLTTASRRQLESDIRQLQDRRINVESELRARDNRIAQLLNDLDNRDARIDSLKEKLALSSEQLAVSENEICLLRDQLVEITEERDNNQEGLPANGEPSESSSEKLQGTPAEHAGFEVDLDIMDILDLSDDSIIDIGIQSEAADESDSYSRLEVLTLPAQHVLVAIDATGQEIRKYLLSKSETTIGRSPSSDIRIASRYISREHARIVREDSQSIIEDLGSTNGFLVNAEEKRRHQLQHGDRLRIGTEEFEFFDLSVST